MARRLMGLLLVCALLAAWPGGFARAEHTRDEVRAAYAAISDWSKDSPYVEFPSPAAPYAPGELTEAARRDALGMLNFTRWLAGLAPVEESLLYDFRCQHGAVLLAAVDRLTHDAPNPGDMDEDFYESAHQATMTSNIARFNWMRPSILREGVAYFLRDDGEANLGVLGHRRWALNPKMAATGFGLANSASGMSYVVMYAHDGEAADVQWDAVCWPAPGAFPATLMHTNLAWSVTLNPERYNLPMSSPVVTLTEEVSGLSFSFFPGQTEGGECFFNFDGYGAGPCLSFRPDFTGTGFSDYAQNQRWTVRVADLADSFGFSRTLEYTVEMISLQAVDVASLEISTLELTLAPGEQAQLGADVIPAYADDLSVYWLSGDESVARVDEDGVVTALRPGRCEIICHSGNGRSDACVLTVTAEN